MNFVPHSGANADTSIGGRQWPIEVVSDGRAMLRRAACQSRSDVHGMLQARGQVGLIGFGGELHRRRLVRAARFVIALQRPLLFAAMHLYTLYLHGQTVKSAHRRTNPTFVKANATRRQSTLLLLSFPCISLVQSSRNDAREEHAQAPLSTTRLQPLTSPHDQRTTQ